MGLSLQRRHQGRPRTRHRVRKHEQSPASNTRRASCQFLSLNRILKPHRHPSLHQYFDSAHQLLEFHAHAANEISNSSSFASSSFGSREPTPNAARWASARAVIQRTRPSIAHRVVIKKRHEKARYACANGQDSDRLTTWRSPKKPIKVSSSILRPFCEPLHIVQHRQ